jgi:hypothetical protein
MRLLDSTDVRPSRLALAVVLSTLSVAAIAGPLAFQALEVQNEIRVGTNDPTGPTVRGVSTVATSGQTSTSSLLSIESGDVTPEPIQDSAPAPITSTVPVSTSAPTTAQPNTEATLGESNSVERTESSDGTQDLLTQSSEQDLQIPNSPGVPPTWVGDPENTSAVLPTTTIPGGDPNSDPSTTEASTSESVTTAGPPITEPLEPVDTTALPVESTTPDGSSTTTEPPDTVITEPLEPIDTTVPSPTTSDQTTSSTDSSPAPTTVETSVPESTSTSDDSQGNTTTTVG